MTRRERAEMRVVTIAYPDGTSVGYMVRPWNPGQALIGPFMSFNAAVAAALENTAGLARGQQMRQEKERRG